MAADVHHQSHANDPLPKIRRNHPSPDPGKGPEGKEKQEEEEKLKVEATVTEGQALAEEQTGRTKTPTTPDARNTETA
uniref:Uncharacterized protein n=1 Tax=Anguilla anguilla TaxID=7936 RepID=A0A0E9V155_ANGAN